MTAQTTIEKIFSTMRLFGLWDFAKSGATTTKTAPYSTDITAVWAMINTDQTNKFYPTDAETGQEKVQIRNPGIKATKYSIYKEFVHSSGNVMGWVRCHAYDAQKVSDVEGWAILNSANTAFKAGMDVTGYINKDFAEEVFEEGSDISMPVKTTNELAAKNSRFKVLPCNHSTLLLVDTSYSVQNGICKLTINDENVTTEDLAQDVAEAVDAYCDNYSVISRSV